MLVSPTAARDVAWADLLHTASGERSREPRVIAGPDGTIEWVGPADEATLPDGVDVLQAAVVAPGLHDAHPVGGPAGVPEQPRRVGPRSDRLDASAPILPELRAIDTTMRPSS